ncbi:NigD-like N-terminal domain-containing protein [Alistipes sp.]|uniref:NigD1/NigD2 family lipoprotein n=1 Tax=Alistipes sp. TaxID=1872444 RepID=UPI0025BBBB2E|nr:NigD-like N-terminal domain-containing protein [Alistipes sp.]
MKKLGLFLIAAIAATAFTACNDDDDSKHLRTLITTVRTLDGGDYYFQRDNGETLYPSNKSRVPGYKPDPDKKQRVIIWFTLQNGIPNYDYNIDLYLLETIYTGTSEVVTDAARLAELGNAKTGFQSNTFHLTKEWLTFYALYPVSDNSKHSFTVIVNEVKDSGEQGAGSADAGQPEATDADYLQLELRHNPGGDTIGYTGGYYVSFDLTPLAQRLEGKKGVVLHIETNEHGRQQIKLDLPREK